MLPDGAGYVEECFGEKNDHFGLSTGSEISVRLNPILQSTNYKVKDAGRNILVNEIRYREI